MNRNVILIYGSVLALILLAAAVRSATQPEDRRPKVAAVSNGIALPPDYRSHFIKYAVVDRVDNRTRDLYIDPITIASIRPGEELPEGTRIIIEAFEGHSGTDGRLQKGQPEPFIHIAEKRDNWSLADLPVSSHVGDWNFASFSVETLQPTDENLNDCFICHDNSATARLDFTFSRKLLDDFLESKTLQYDYCNRPGRSRCR